MLENSFCFSRRSRKLSGKARNLYLARLLWAIVIISLSVGLPILSRRVFAVQPAAQDPCETAGTVTKLTAQEPSIIETACELIYQGKFDAADELIKHTGKDERNRSPFLARLSEIVEEAKSIHQRRQSARENAYREQLAELEKSRAKIDVNDVNNISNKNDPNDANDMVTALSVIAKASEFALPAQKEQLMSDAFVKKLFLKAIDRAAKFEVEGKWLEAYTNCYYWLAVIDPNTKAYLDYAERLLDKASIAASFQDSPCETRDQRYKGIKKEMFIRAVDTLSLNYVSIVDYSQMAVKGIERCKLLAEVIGVSSLQSPVNAGLATAPNDVNASEPNKSAMDSLKVDSKKLTAWSAACQALLDEVNQSPTGFDKDKFIETFEKVMALNTASAELPETILVAQFAEASLGALDPYTVMVWPRQVQDFEKMMTNEFTGIGIEISKEKGLLTVASLLPDTPAFRTGLDAGDVIEAVDGLETKDMTLICAVNKITGPKGTKVTLAIKRQGEEKPREITITRDKITVPTIRGWQRTEEGKWLYLVDTVRNKESISNGVDEPNNSTSRRSSSKTRSPSSQAESGDKIGYVRLTSFSGETSTELEKVLNELEAGGGLRGLILDLRFNSGGLLDSAIEVTDKFLKKGLIVKTQPGTGFGKLPTYAVAHEKGTHPDYPLVILINAGSASASEIVAGALADQMHKRAILVGERTHGKGSVQGVTHYPGDGAQLKYTMAHYYLPSGQKVESQETVKKQGRKDWGVGPNIEIELISNEIRKMIDVQRDNDVLVQADRPKAGLNKPASGGGNSTRVVKKYTLEETLAADPQLAIGVLIVKTKLIQAQKTGDRRQEIVF